MVKMLHKSKIVLTVIVTNLLLIVVGLDRIWTAINFELVYHQFESFSAISIIFVATTIGIIIGSILACILADNVGRKNALLGSIFPFIFSFIALQFTNDKIITCIAKVIGGVSIGGIYTVLPVYIAEITENYNRGICIALMYPALMLGQEIPVLIINWYTFPSVIINIIGVVLTAIVALVVALVAPESPYYFIRKAKGNFPENRLRQMGVTDLELREMRNNIDPNNPRNQSHDAVMTCMTPSPTLKALIIVGLSIVFMNFSGFYTIWYYVRMQSTPNSSTHWYKPLSDIIGHILSSFVGILLVDRLGRKLCLMLSYSGMALTALVIFILSIFNIPTHNAILIVLLTLFMVSLSIGAVSIIQVYKGELFPLKTRMIGSACMTTFMFILEFFAPIIFNLLGTISLLLNAILLFIGIIVVKFVFLETKNKNLHRIKAELKRRS